MDCSPPASSLHGISQARILEWVAISFSRGSSQARDQTCISCLASGFLTLSHLGSPLHLMQLLLLLILSRSSRVRLCETPETAAHQAPPSLGFSRQEHWSGLPFPSPKHESEVAESCLTLSSPMDYSPPGSPIHGTLQARALILVYNL